MPDTWSTTQALTYHYSVYYHPHSRKLWQHRNTVSFKSQVSITQGSPTLCQLGGAAHTAGSEKIKVEAGLQQGRELVSAAAAPPACPWWSMASRAATRTLEAGSYQDPHHEEHGHGEVSWWTAYTIPPQNGVWRQHFKNPALFWLWDRVQCYRCFKMCK